jgi:hypothetical protein
MEAGRKILLAKEGSMSEWELMESKVAETLGAPREALMEMRKKDALYGLHWRKRGRRVVWTEKGLDFLSERFDDRGGVLGRVKGSSQATDEGEREIEAVVKKMPLNKRVLMAEAEKGVIRVRVNSSANFIPGMKIRCARVVDDLYDLVGRCPRYRGRW